MLNFGQRVAILRARDVSRLARKVEKLSNTLHAPLAKAYLAKALLPDHHPLTTGGIGHLGTASSS